ncbi:MAG: YggS family pyridoxal phosphate enzyme [Alphaproteobacteria bacterium TMED87]|nr:YggS family pyridoxal phosphate-dependent enzyme [Rhodospirillaceae bacterium]OUV10615.1 MAG: YggS family pyridoxal phosphate enzyme [Alphaproteobacteria bacterium TMED87]
MKIQDRYTDIKNNINQALLESPYDRKIELIAVSKKQSLESVNKLLDVGHRCFGENQVQEATEKWTNLKNKISNLQLHMIGPLQTNKVRQAVRLFDYIQTLDRIKLASKISRECKKENTEVKCFIQVNTGIEDQKSGIRPSEVREFYNICVNDYRLNVVGLMCLPPKHESPETHFAMLNTIAEENKIKFLSMGMTNDYKVGIKFGATHIRVGEGVFGKRN